MMLIRSLTMVKGGAGALAEKLFSGHNRCL